MASWCYAFAMIFGGMPGGSAMAAGQSFDLDHTKKVLGGLIDTALREEGIPSISIALVKGDTIVWRAAFGYANVYSRTPATPDTLYSTGSTFKSVTAAAIMQLAERGKLRLTDPVNEHLGESRVQDRLQSEKPVNFIHILSHWSGLTDDASTRPLWGRELPPSLDKLVARLYSIRAPEATWSYNNSAYAMAGLLVQKISGKEYEDYMVEEMLKPLGVHTPHPVYPSPEMVERMALPYAAGGFDAEPKPVGQVHFDVYPAGDIYLTAEDMAKYLGAQVNGGVFNGHRVLSEESVKEMQTARFGGDYGFGLEISKNASGHTIITHGGAIAGQRSKLVGDVDAHVGVYIMSNSDAEIPAEIADAALRLLRGEAYTPASTVTIDPRILASYAGSYQVDGQAPLTVIQLRGRLAIHNADEKVSHVLVGETENRFKGRANPGTTYTFVRNPSGPSTELVVEDSGTKEIARRKP